MLGSWMRQSCYALAPSIRVSLHHLGGNGRQARGKQHDVVSAEPPGGHRRQHEIDNCRVAEPLADPAGKPQPRQDLVERAVHRGEEIGKRIGHSHAVDDKRKKRDGLYQLCALKAAVQHHGDSKLDGDHHHVHGQIDKVVAQGKPQVRRLCEHFDVIAYPVERPLRRNAVPACKAHGHQIHRRVDHEYQQQDHRHHERQNNKAVPAFVDGLHTVSSPERFWLLKARKAAGARRPRMKAAVSRLSAYGCAAGELYFIPSFCARRTSRR